jgi:hypothetical protein
MFAAVGAAGVVAAFVLGEQRVPAGLATLAAGALLVASDYRSEDGGPRAAFAFSTTERLVDALVFGSLAWELLGPLPEAGVAALTALTLAFLSSYIRARARSLGYTIMESGLARPARMLAVSVGLLSNNIEGGLWTAAGVGLLSIVARLRELRAQVRPA